ncbi:unnamed protein product, partial [marine sediment metagenome]
MQQDTTHTHSFSASRRPAKIGGIIPFLSFGSRSRGSEANGAIILFSKERGYTLSTR